MKEEGRRKKKMACPNKWIVFFQVLDTPGMCDTKISDEDTAVLITKAVIGLHPGPHALLYVLKTDRFTDEEYSTFRKLEHIFDKRFTDYLIVIFTGGDNFEHDGTTAEEVIERAPQTLKQLLDDCNNRYVVFNNRATDKRPQVDELLTTVREMVEANGQRPHYRCKRYERLGDNLEQEVRGRVAAVEEKMLQEQEAFKKQMDKKEKEMEKAQKQKEKEFKRKIAKKQMAESEAKKKIKEMEKERERERERMNRERREMEEQHREELRERSRQEERVIRTETVEGGGMFSRIKGGLRRAASGLFDVVTAPFEEIFSWWWKP